MCVILLCPQEVRPSLEILQLCRQRNPHGAGIAWRSGSGIEWLKIDDVHEIHRIARRVKGEIIIHFRLASIGGVRKELRHPFPVTSRTSLADRGRARAALFQNGTWTGYAEALRCAGREGFRIPDGPMSDTRAAAFLCSISGHKFLKNLLPSRWVYFSATETVKYGRWFESGGILFSNLKWRDAEPTSPAPERRRWRGWFQALLHLPKS